jgi:hypothetical protein
MAIKKDCVVKYLKHDFKEIGAIAGATAIVIIIAVGATTILQNHPFQPSANQVFDIISGIVILFFTAVVAYVADKSLFAFDDPETGIKSQHGYKTILGMSLTFEALFIAIYTVLSNFAPISSYTWSIYPDIAISVILLVIGVPIACAIARCKE